MAERFAQGAVWFWAQMLGGNVWVKALFGAIGAGVAYILPSAAVRDTAIAAAFMVALDTVTGIASSLRKGKPLSSARFSRVLSKLIAYGSVVAVVSVCGKFLPGLSDFRIPGITAALYLILATEGISVLENANSLGVALPKGLVKWLKGKLEDEANALEEK